jgi:hypothetical protein
MPEPTTGPDELDQARIEEIRTKVARWTPQGASDLMFDLATISALLNAYDQIAARAAAAEAAVQRVREYITKRDDELLDYRDAVLNDGRRESRGAAFERAASELRAVMPLLATPTTDLPVTVHGRVHRVEVRNNRAGASYLEITLGTDTDDPDLTTVTVPPAVYAAMDAPLKPYEGEALQVEGCTRTRVEILATSVRQLPDEDGAR